MFKPSKNGFHFPNFFASAPVVTIHIPLLGNYGIGDSAGGLCGGMAFAAADYYNNSMLAPESADVPAPDTVLFNYLCERLIDSFHLPLGAMRFFEWMNFSDQYVTRLTLIEFEKIKTCLDHSLLVPLGLVTIYSHNPLDIGQCHQVLAYGHSGDTLLIYDPNQPDNDEVTLAVGSDSIKLTGDLTVRGFFQVDYAAKVPPKQQK